MKRKRIGGLERKDNPGSMLLMIVCGLFVIVAGCAESSGPAEKAEIQTTAQVPDSLSDGTGDYLVTDSTVYVDAMNDGFDGRYAIEGCGSPGERHISDSTVYLSRIVDVPRGESCRVEIKDCTVHFEGSSAGIDAYDISDSTVYINATREIYDRAAVGKADDLNISDCTVYIDGNQGSIGVEPYDIRIKDSSVHIAKVLSRVDTSADEYSISDCSVFVDQMRRGYHGPLMDDEVLIGGYHIRDSTVKISEGPEIDVGKDGGRIVPRN